MRGIKYRAWREDIEVMEDVREMVWDNNGLKKQTGEQFLNIVGFREFESYTGAGDLKNVVIMQYTGLTDVNGVDIYEGDIVRLGSFISEDYKKRIGQVVFERGKYIFYENAIFKCDLDVMGATLEVIGNIYEHKRLLKENKYLKRC